MTDLELAVTALVAKQPFYARLWDYYEGTPPLAYSTERLRAVFHDLDAKFSENWCAVVVDSVIDRVNLAGFRITGNDDAAALLNKLFLSTELNLDSDDAHLAALVCGDAFIIVWEGENGPEAFYNDPRACYIKYDVENPRKKLWAAKWWLADDGRCKLTLYYPDRLEKYTTPNALNGRTVDEHTKFDLEQEPEKNPYGVIPVFHLRRDRRTIKSEISDVLPLQDAVNKLLSDAMIAAEFGAFRQRYVISTAGVDGLKNAPNEIWDIPAGDGGGQATSVGEFSQTDLGVYFAAIDKLATAMSVITRTPKHYVYGQGGDPSGEALITMEAPLIRKCARYIERFTATWQRIGSFLLHVAGVEIAPEQITPLFDRPETVQPRTTAEIRELGVRAGVPLVTMLRDEGKDEAWLADMERDRAAQEAARSATLAAAMLEAQRRFDGGGVEGE